MLEYMLTYKNGFNSSCDYFKAHDEAMRHGLESRKFGFIPEAIYKYNEASDKFDILIGKFTITPKEV